MLSLYIHIPFCRHKCKYCSFFVLPQNDAALIDKEHTVETIKDKYLTSLLAENTDWCKQFPNEQVKTIYIGGGTPFELGNERLFELIDTVLASWDTEFLEELTIELNPDPFDDVLRFVVTASKKYMHLYKLRFSIGVQTFDDTILQDSKRNYVFNNLIWFFRDLQKIKKPNVHYNFDFIAFGKQKEQLRDSHKIDFFQKLVASHVADGYSLYTLELFPGSEWYNSLQHEQSHLRRLQASEDEIMEEFETLQTIIENEGYTRYETSNFALMGKESIHNIVYRTLESYIGMGINSSSFLNKKTLNSCTDPSKIWGGKKEDVSSVGLRFQNTKHWKQYLGHTRLDMESVEIIDQQTKDTEKGFLSLRLGKGLQEVSKYSHLFEKDWEKRIQMWQEQGLVNFDKEKDTLSLTDDGMNLYNSIVTDLFSTL